MISEVPISLVIVFGVSGSGKSTIAKILAEKLNAQYLDADDFHSESAKTKMSKGIPLNDDDRIPWIDLIRTYVKEQAFDVETTVLAFSGLKKRYRDKFREMGLNSSFIFLDAPYSKIKQRINKRHEHFFNPALLANQFDVLERPSKAEKVVRVDATKDIPYILSKIVSELEAVESKI